MPFIRYTSCMSHIWLDAHFSFPLGASLGANPSIPFGASSTTLRTSDAMQMGCCNSPSGPTDVDPEPKMPFLKKWVRTRHAILFRLSNRTVQVLFFDRRYTLFLCDLPQLASQLSCNIWAENVLFNSLRHYINCPNSAYSGYPHSEVLLSSEARMVTYVSKQNVRSEHSLEEVLQTGEEVRQA